MTMIIELHLIQNFAPSCLNRDDTNSPKDCVFGGVRRARISSQCIKRAIRQHFKSGELLNQNEMAVRTKRLVDRLTATLTSEGKDPNAARKAAIAAIQATGIKTDEEKTSYLVYLSEHEIQGLKEQILAHWDTLVLAVAAPAEPPAGEEKKVRGKAKKEKAGALELPEPMKKAIQKIFDGAKAADLALFGRMLADLPEKNIDAASQVAHALSTHKIDMEMDFYTAVDDLKPDDSSGADMMGTVEFNSACFYRYAVVDYKKLLSNLGGDAELATRTLRAFLQASAEAIPTGKQNTFAAQNPPSFVMVVAREGGVPWSLANAFEKPVWVPQGGLVTESIKQLDAYWGRLQKMYGAPIRSLAWTMLDETLKLNYLGSPKGSFAEVLDATMSAAAGGREVAP